MSNYVNWITNQKFIIDDEFARDALIKYILESYSRQGPEYSISKFTDCNSERFVKSFSMFI